MSGGGTTECEDELFALAYEDGVKDKYMCHVYEKSEKHMTSNVNYPHNLSFMYTTANLHIVITYSTSHWIKVSAVTEGLHHKCHVYTSSLLKQLCMV